MKRNTYGYVRVLYALLAACLLSSCGVSIYNNLGPNVPMFREKGEVAFNVSQGTSETSMISGFQAAAAVSSHVAVIASYYSVTRGNYFEVGGGGYWLVDEDESTYELFGGVGFGNIEGSPRRTNSVGSHFNASYTKYFIQPSVGFSRKIGEIAFTPRIGLVSFTNWSVTSSSNQLIYDGNTFFESRANNFVFEPAVTARVGFKGIKIQIQYAFSTFGSIDYLDYTADRNYFAVGLNILVSRRWRAGAN